MTRKIYGQLEIDTDRGVIYFHSTKTGGTVLRICSLPHPIPEVQLGLLLDITHMYGSSWDTRKIRQERAEKEAAK